MKPGNRALVVTIVLLFVVSVGIQAVRDRDLKPFEPRGGMLWLQPGPAVKRMALGYDTVAKAKVEIEFNRRPDKQDQEV